jgi:hypothetical protein
VSVVSVARRASIPCLIVDDTDLPPGQYRTDDFSLVLLGRRHRLAPSLSALRRHPSNPDVREPEVHTATGSTAWCFWPAGTSVYAAS